MGRLAQLQRRLRVESRGGANPARGWPSAVELTVRTVRDSLDDRVPGLAAEIAFYLMLSVPPLLIAVVGGVGYVGEVLGADIAETLRRRALEASGAIFTPDTIQQVIAPTLTTLLKEGRGDVASLGIVFTVWSASRALNVLLSTVTIAYDLEAIRRAGWRRRLLAFGLTIVAIVGGLVVIPLLVAGPRALAALTEPWGLSDTILAVWKAAYWPTVGLLATLLLSSLYHFAVPWRTPWRRDLPGAVLAMVVWLLGSVGLRSYTSATIETEAAYQAVAAPLVMLLWLYLIGFAMLLGAELNAEIERMWPTAPERRARSEATEPNQGARRRA